MPRTTSTTEATTNDTSTLPGFYAEFDVQFGRLQAAKNWCEEGRRTAYSWVPAPEDRMAATVPAEYLNEAGQAWQQEQNTTRLAEVKASVRASVKRYIGDYLTLDEANEALTGLGIDPLVRTTTHRGSFNAYGYFHTPQRMAPEVRRELSDALAPAVRAVFAEFIASHPDVTFDESSVSTPVDSDRYGDTNWS